MLEIKVNRSEVKVQAKGTISDLISEYACLTAALMYNFLMPFDKETEYNRVFGKMTVAFNAGIEQAIDKRKAEVSRGSTE
jgi:hypothetical protein